MKVEVKETGPVSRSLSVEVPPDVVEEAFVSAYAELNRRVNLPGFRPGKVPITLLEQRYGETVQGDVLRKLLTAYYQKAVQECGIKPVELPEIADVHLHKREPFRFTAKVEVKPAIQLGTYRGLTLKRPHIEAGAAQLDEALQMIREQHAQLVACPPEETAGQHDLLVVDLEGQADGNPIPGSAAQGVTLQLGSPTLLPGFSEQLTGTKAGEKVEVRVTLPAEYHQKAFAGRSAVFTVQIRELKRKLLPDLDDEFAKDVGSFDNLEALRAKVEEDLKARAAHEEERLSRSAALRSLIESHGFELPTSLVDRELQEGLHQLEQRLPRGVSLEEAKVDVEAFRKEYLPVASGKVKGRLILEAIADQEKVDVSREELDAALAKIAAEMRATPEDIRRVIITQSGSLDGFRARLREDKALDLVCAEATFE